MAAMDEVDVQVGNEVQTFSVPSGMSDADVVKQIQKLTRAQVAPAGARAIQGPLGVVPKQTRAGVRSEIERLSGLQQFGAASALPLIGTGIGTGVGALTGPAAPFAIPLLGGLGGLGGELLSQETGISPKSKAAAIASGVAPVVGPAIARGIQQLGKGAGFLVGRSPMARMAQSTISLEKGKEKALQLGIKILESQKGLLSRTAKVLFRAGRMKRASVNSTQLPSTRNALNLLSEEVQDFKSFPEGRQIIRTIKSVNEMLFAQPTVSLQRLQRVRQLIGASTRALESKAGIKLGASKKFFAEMSKDLDRIAEVPPGISVGKRASEQATLIKAANQRAKLEFSVRDLNEIITKHSDVVPGKRGFIEMNPKAILQEIELLTNPQSPNFDNNFASAFIDDLPEIKGLFAEMTEIMATSGAGGPGSLVLRGATAGAGRKTMVGLGAALGLGTGGIVGGTAGAMLGAQAPEMITSLLLTSGGRQGLKFFTTLGRGQLNLQKIAQLSQLASQVNLRSGQELKKKFIEAPERQGGLPLLLP